DPGAGCGLLRAGPGVRGGGQRGDAPGNPADPAAAVPGAVLPAASPHFSPRGSGSRSPALLGSSPLRASLGALGALNSRGWNHATGVGSRPATTFRGLGGDPRDAPRPAARGAGRPSTSRTCTGLQLSIATRSVGPRTAARGRGGTPPRTGSRSPG